MRSGANTAPFRLLRRHFWNGLFDHEMLAEGTDPRSGLIIAGLMVGTPALPLALFLALAGQANATAITAFFIALSMACTTVATVMAWPKLLPEGADLRILRSLPLRGPQILRAKLAALGMLLAALLLLINVYAVTAVPAAMPQRGSLLRLMSADALALAAAGGFAFFTWVCVYSGLVFALGSRRAARVVPLAQFLALAAGLTALMDSLYLLELPAWAASPHPPAWLRAAPPLWFLGLQKVLAGASNPPVWFGRATKLTAVNGDPIWFWYARCGLEALAATAVLAAILYLLAFWRLWGGALDTMPPGAGSGIVSRAREWLAGWALRTPRSQSLFQFVSEALERDPQPRLILAASGALGIAFAGASCLEATFGGAGHLSAFARTAYFAAPLDVCFFLVLGVRYSFSMPVELPARWIFRTGEAPPGADARAAMRGVLWLYAIAPVLLIWAPAAVWGWGMTLGGWVVAWDIVAAGIAAELLLLGSGRIPFTRAHVTGTVTRRTMLPLGWLAIAYVAARIADLENRPIQGTSILLLAASLGVLVLLFRWHATEPEDLETTPEYDESPEWAVQRLFVD